MQINKKFKKILLVPDLQIPYEHKDALKFIKAVKNKYKPELVIQVGDIVDFECFSSYAKNPNSPNPRLEVDMVRKHVAEWVKVLPSLYCTLGNHERRLIRLAHSAGIPDCILKDFNDIIGAPKSWKFTHKLKINWNDIQNRILVVHTGTGARQGNLAIGEHSNVIHGHLHTNFTLKYHSTTDSLHYDFCVGCLIDDSAPCFSYASNQTKRPILGCGVIIDNNPRMLPMLLNKKGEWDGKVA